MRGPSNEAPAPGAARVGRLEVGPSYVLPDELLVGAEPLVRNLLIGRAVCERLRRPSRRRSATCPTASAIRSSCPRSSPASGSTASSSRAAWATSSTRSGSCSGGARPTAARSARSSSCPRYSNFVVPRCRRRAGADRGDRRALRSGVAPRRRARRAAVQRRGPPPRSGATCRRCAQSSSAGCRAPASRSLATRDYVAAVDPDDLPAYTGELLGSRIQNVLRGVNSARLYLKQANERAERRLLEVETLGALRTLSTGERFPGRRLQARVARSCSSAIRTTRSAAARATRSTATCSSATSSSSGRSRTCSAERLAGSRPRADAETGVGVVNLLPYRRRGLVELPGHEPAVIELDGFSARSVALTAAAPPPGPPARRRRDRERPDQRGGGARRHPERARQADRPAVRASART